MRGAVRKQRRLLAAVAVIALLAPIPLLAFVPDEPNPYQATVEFVFVAIALGGLVAIHRWHIPDRVDRLLFPALAVLVLYGANDIVDEYVIYPRWAAIVAEDGPLILGTVLLLAAFLRWAELRNEREQLLRRRERELEAERDRLEAVTSIISHDLRSPMNVATGYASMLAEDDSSAADNVVDAVNRMDEIIDDTQMLASLDDDAVEREPVAVGEAASRAWANVDAPEADLVVDVAADDDVSADDSLLAQLFENLFRNALDHGPADVTVTVGRGPDTGRLYVGDDGPGIPPEDRERVLERGYSTGGDGSGLGLSIVTRIAEVHGWELVVTESDAGGARFELAGS
ncbi:MAG: sensor histidine kinase [Halolamina sp.]